LKKNEVGNIQISEQEQPVQFRARAVVLSNGGRQTLHPDFYKKWFPFMAERKDRVILSDYFMQRHLYQATMEKIVKEKIKKIVIIGGSASGFSAAWLLIKGPAKWHIKETADLKVGKLKHLSNCKECCKCLQRKLILGTHQ